MEQKLTNSWVILEMALFQCESTMSNPLFTSFSSFFFWQSWSKAQFTAKEFGFNIVNEAKQLKMWAKPADVTLPQLHSVCTLLSSSFVYSYCQPNPEIQRVFLSGPPDFQYQNEKTCSANEELFYIENFVKKLVLVCCNLFFILVLKIGRTS